MIQPKSWESGHLTLGVANDFYMLWLEEHYLPLIEKAVAAVSGEADRVQLVVDASLPMKPEDGDNAGEQPGDSALEPSGKSDAAPRGRKAASPKRRPAMKPKGGSSSMPLDPHLTFDRFVVGPSNDFAHAAALAVAQSPAQAYNPLLIYGGSGLGKTHLIQAIAHQILKDRPGSVVAYVSSETFVNEYIDALLNKKLPDFRRRYRRADALLIDDIHFLAGKEQMQEEFFHTFNALRGRHKQIILTSDRPARDVPGLTPRLVSRFEWGLVAELERPDLETRVAILHKKASDVHVPIPVEVIQFIAERIRSSVRQLEGALIRVASYASMTGRPITLDSVEALLRDTLDPECRDEPTFGAIQRAVTEHFDLRLSDMTSKRRPASVALPRQVAMYLCRTLTSQSLPAIGDAFGRNHATVLHACKTVTSRIQNDPLLRQTVGSLRYKLGAD